MRRNLIRQEETAFCGLRHWEDQGTGDFLASSRTVEMKCFVSSRGSHRQTFSCTSANSRFTPRRGEPTWTECLSSGERTHVTAWFSLPSRLVRFISSPGRDVGWVTCGSRSDRCGRVSDEPFAIADQSYFAALCAAATEDDAKIDIVKYNYASGKLLGSSASKYRLQENV